MDDRIAQLLAGSVVPMPITPGTYDWNRLNSQLLQQEGKSGPPAPVIPLSPPAQKRGAMGEDFGLPVMSDAQPDPVSGGDQFAQASGPYLISIQGGGKYSVVDQRTGQVRYTGTIDGARQAQAQLMAGGR